MCSNTRPLPPIAQLVGVVENSGEHSACSLVFHVETKDGQPGILTYGHVIDAFKFAELHRAVPALSAHWWARIGDSGRCLPAETNEPSSPDHVTLPTNCATARQEPVRTDYAALIEFENTATGEAFVITLATLLQCLCIAEEQLIIPPFEPEWAASTIPTLLRERSRCKIERGTMQ